MEKIATICAFLLGSNSRGPSRKKIVIIFILLFTLPLKNRQTIHTRKLKTEVRE